ncbi:MAG TPA: radical SAM family heme chaperone HemW [Dongiaceae bacterium]|nr:radical SAM family heme chaperone HemW [Dongiaceae bacterium]
MIGLYLHVPYCTVRCSYCDFYLVTGRGRDLGAYARALTAEIAAAADAGVEAPGPAAINSAARSPADTIHLGGGTPSLLPAAALRPVLEAALRFCPPSGPAEIALEANPEDLDAGTIDLWRTAGVTRLAIGVQSFDDARLRLMRRPHDAARAAQSVSRARAAGFASVGVDLILGMPGARPDPTLDDVARAIDLGVDHLSLYLLEIHPGTRLGRAVALGKEAPLEADAAASVYEAAADRLIAAGFEHYEISNFARPGHRSRHNLKYWTDEEYLGFGPSAHSYLGGERWSNPPDLAGYLARGGVGSKRLDDPQPRATRGWEALSAGLRLLEGVDLDQLEARYPGAMPAGGDTTIEALVSAGFMTIAGRRLALTRRGRLVSNELFERLEPKRSGRIS